LEWIKIELEINEYNGSEATEDVDKNADAT
jgi:hypothetical protein